MRQYIAACDHASRQSTVNRGTGNDHEQAQPLLRAANVRIVATRPFPAHVRGEFSLLRFRRTGEGTSDTIHAIAPSGTEATFDAVPETHMLPHKHR